MSVDAGERAGGGGPDRPAIGIRRARAADADRLTDLAFRSKAYWGYDPDFMEACRPDLRVSVELIERAEVNVAELDRRPVGFYSLVAKPDRDELEHLFVEPDRLRQGIGRALWVHAVARARARDVEELYIESDPYAEPFYLGLGAERVGEVASRVRPGRRLPLLRLTLEPAAPAL